MEIKNIHTVIKSLVLFSVMTIFASCEDITSPQCEECYDNAPTDVTIDITIYNKYIAQCDTTPVIDIYDDDYKTLITSFTATSDCLSPSLSVERSYKFTATYIINGIKYVASDYVTPKIKFSKSECESSCYYIINKEVNLALKYIE